MIALFAVAALSYARELVDANKLPEAEQSVRQYLQASPDSAEAHYLLGYILFKENNPKPSLAEYAEGARHASPGAGDLEVIGCDYFLLEDYLTADKWLTKSLEQNRNNALALYFLGRTRYNLKRFDDAVALFTESLKIDPKSFRTHENLGLAYDRLGRPQEAIAEYRAAVALTNDNASPYLGLGGLLLPERPSEALTYLSRAVALSPRSPTAHQQLGKAYLALGQLEKAQAELEKSLEIDPNSGPTHFMLAEAYRKQGMLAKAAGEVKRYEALTASHSSFPDALAEGRAMVETNQFAQAEQAVRRYLETNTNSADAHFLLGYILFREQKPEASLAEYTAGARFRTPGANDLEVVGGDYVLLHDYADADKWFTKSLEWNPGSFQTRYYLARDKYNENRFEEAVDLFQQCAKIDPKSVKAQDNLGLSLQGLNKNDQAETAFRAAIALEGDAKNDSGPYLDLGSLLVDQDRAKEAVSYLLEAVQIAPQDMRGHRELGKAYLRLNELDQAQTELERSAQLAPNEAPVHFMLAQLYRKRGLMEKARVETDRYRELTGAHSTDQTLGPM